MTPESHDPRLIFLASLDLNACRIEFSSAPIVLLCGGRVNNDHDAAGGPPAVKSLRHAITNALTDFEVFRPEEITSWHADGVFKDLMSFERELAGICSLVVIILESEGALVELGAFSQLAEMSEKIVAISSNLYANDDSFINLGILRYILDKNVSSVKKYPWEILNPSTISQEIIDDVTSDINEELAKLPKSQVFRANQNSHGMVAICELLRLFLALKEHEILEYLEVIGITISKEILKGQLFLLAEFKIIKKQSYSDALFYVHTNEIFHRFRLAMKDKAESSDTLRIQMQCREYYEANNGKHRNRNRAIALAAKGAAK